MSKSLGQRIGIKFTEAITLFDDSQLTLYESKQFDLTSAGSYSSSYPVANLKDGSLSTFWMTASAQNFVLMDHFSIKQIRGIKWYQSTSNTPRTFTLYKSDDGVAFEQFYDGASLSGADWRTFEFEEQIMTRYLKIVFSVSEDYARIYELRSLILDYNHQTTEFKITGEEPLYRGGPYIEKQYKIKQIMEHDTVEHALLIIMDDYTGRFNNVGVGALTVTYDAAIGKLSGKGGKVASFSLELMPEGLIPKLNPIVTETLSATPTVNASMKEVVYQSGYFKEHLTAQAEVSITFTDISIVNP